MGDRLGTPGAVGSFFHLVSKKSVVLSAHLFFFFCPDLVSAARAIRHAAARALPPAVPLSALYVGWVSASPESARTPFAGPANSLQDGRRKRTATSLRGRRGQQRQHLFLLSALS